MELPIEELPNIIDPKFLPDTIKIQFFKCIQCEARLINDTQLKIHNMIHSKDHTCFVCTQFIKNRFQFVGHVRKHMLAKPFSCSEKNCDKNFASIRESKLHYRVHSDERPFMCTECGKSFKTSHTLREHETVHTGVKKFKCNNCGRNFATTASHRRHVKIMHEAVRSYQCNFCHLTFTSRQGLDEHKVIHTDVDPLKCQLCQEIFTDLEEFEVHKKKHVQMKESGRCEYCGNQTFYFALQFHIKKTHQPRPCDACNLIFFDEKSLVNHTRSHIESHEKEELICQICGKKFDFLRYLKAHLKRHESDYKKFKCELCSKAFPSKRDLNDHINVHTDVKNFKCDICQKPFRTKQSVRKHKAIHSDKRPFECHSCSKTFKKQSILQKHMLTHSRALSYECFCGKTFKARHSLRVHVLSHKRHQQHLCKVCSKSFRFFSCFRSHECQKRGHSGYDLRKKCFECKKTVKSVLSWILHRVGHARGKMFWCDVCTSGFKHRYQLVLHHIGNHHKMSVKMGPDDITSNAKENVDGVNEVEFLEVKIENNLLFNDLSTS